jgi:hypothetical protein
VNPEQGAASPNRGTIHAMASLMAGLISTVLAIWLMVESHGGERIEYAMGAWLVGLIDTVLSLFGLAEALMAFLAFERAGRARTAKAIAWVASAGVLNLGWIVLSLFAKVFV